MSVQDEAISILLRLPSATLVELGRALSGGNLRHGFSRQTLQPFTGDQTGEVEQALRVLSTVGFNVATSGIFCESLGRALAERDATERSIQLVLSGPQVVGTPVLDTRTTVLSLFEEATEEVIISSYVFYEAVEFFRRLAEKHDSIPSFRVTFVVDLSHRREPGDSPVSVQAKTFANDFLTKHWPGKRSPEIWYDPRAFEEQYGGVLHAKTVVVDKKVALITSANFTGAAQSRNIEAGVLIRQPRIAARLHSYFLGLMTTNALRRIAC